MLLEIWLGKDNPSAKIYHVAQEGLSGEVDLMVFRKRIESSSLVN